MTADIIEVTDADFEEVVQGSDLPVLVDFWADWCAPCRMVAPVIEELARDRAGTLKVVKLNVDANAETAARFRVLSIPTVVLFRDGEVVSQVVGALPKESLVKELGL